MKAGREPQFFGEQRVLGGRVQGWVIKEDRRVGGGQCDGWRIHLFPDPPSPPFSLVVVVGGFRSVLKNGNLGICSYESSSSPYIDGRWGVWDLEVILYTFRHLAKKQGTARKEKPQ